MAPPLVSATGTISIYDSGGSNYYKVNDGSPTLLSLPVQFANSNPSGDALNVLFTTNITLTSINDYFVCGSSNIQFGSTSLNPDGTRPTITIDNTPDYPGVVQNGTSGANGNSNVYVYNLVVNTSGAGTTLAQYGGWIGQRFFGKGVSENYIVNCSSTSDIPSACGGIVGSYAGSGSGATLYVYGCSSSGAVSQLGGGIVGQNAGESSGFVSCEQCWTFGAINDFAGGIFGDYAGYGGSANAYACFSLGAIGGNGGGIYGRYAGANQVTGEGTLNGQATATACFSQGNIGADGGGIFGLGAANASEAGGSTTAMNCYSAGIVTTTGNGIYGTGEGGGAIQSSTCYIANGNWSDTGANLKLTGVPLGSSVGSIWVSAIINTPYILNEYGYSPYELTNISPSSQLVQVYLENVQAGETTSMPVVSGSFLLVNVTDPTITIDTDTGVISTTAETPPGEYTLVIVFTGPIPFSVTTFALGVLAPPTPPVPSTTEQQLPSSRGKGFDYHTLADIERGKRLILERLTNPNIRFKNYADYNKYRMAMYASLKPNL